VGVYSIKGDKSYRIIYLADPSYYGGTAKSNAAKSSTTSYRHHDFVQELLLLWQQKHSQGYLHLVQSNAHDESKALEENSMMQMMVNYSGRSFLPTTPLHHSKYKVR
jgi:hypothetical protein